MSFASEEEYRRYLLGIDASRWRACGRCELSASRERVVYGRGSPGADLLIVEGAPSVEEDASGLALSGRAGELLVKLASAVGLRLRRAFIAPIVACRPRGRAPEKHEREACRPRIEGIVDVLVPTAILLLGASAGRWASIRDPLGEAGAVPRVSWPVLGRGGIRLRIVSVAPSPAEVLAAEGDRRRDALRVLARQLKAVSVVLVRHGTWKEEHEESR